MTPREKLCLEFLSDKMEATARMVGEKCWDDTFFGHGEMGKCLLKSLAIQGFVMRLPELKAWRLTKAGRDWIRENEE